MEALKALLMLSVMYGLPIGLYLNFAERAESTGYTATSKGRSWEDRDKNYAVFRKRREIYIITTLAPRSLVEMDGKIVRIDRLLAGGRLPMQFYSDASSAEEALWRKHFGHQEASRT